MYLNVIIWFLSSPSQVLQGWGFEASPSVQRIQLGWLRTISRQGTQMNSEMSMWRNQCFQNYDAFSVRNVHRIPARWTNGPMLADRFPSCHRCALEFQFPSCKAVGIGFDKYQGQQFPLHKDWWWSVLKPDQLNFQICFSLRKNAVNPKIQNWMIWFCYLLLRLSWCKGKLWEDSPRQVAGRSTKPKWNSPVARGTVFRHIHLWQEPWGDRRQEIVFIGGPCMRKSDITKLDSEMPSAQRGDCSVAGWCWMSLDVIS